MTQECELSLLGHVYLVTRKPCTYVLSEIVVYLIIYCYPLYVTCVLNYSAPRLASSLEGVSTVKTEVRGTKGAAAVAKKMQCV